MKALTRGRHGLDRETTKRFLIALGIFSLFFCLQLKNLNAAWFGTDEGDIVVGGKAIARGYKLYRDYASQHMPFPYYFSALFDLLGFTSAALQRVAFYGVFALLWTAIYYRYRHLTGKIALILYPILFLSAVSTYDLGHAILSEHFAGVGAVILFLEFLQYYRTSEVRIDNCIWISLSIVLTFGCLFISAFPVAVIGVCVLINEIKLHRGGGRPRKLGYFVRRYCPLIAIVALPWVLLLAYYLLTGTLKDFIKGAYLVNRRFYPLYIGGFGSSVLSPLIGFPESVARALISSVEFQEVNINLIVHLLLILIPLVHIIGLLLRRKVMLGVCELLFWLNLANRGAFNYHGTHWVAMGCFLTAVALTDVPLPESEPRAPEGRGLKYRTAAWLLVCVLSAPYLQNISALAEVTIYEPVDANTSLVLTVLDTITEPDEGIWELCISNELFAACDRPAIYSDAMTPWGWSNGGAALLERLAAGEAPRVAYWFEDHNVWGFYQRDYAPEIAAFMSEHYTRYRDTYVYIRNDYWDEAIQKIDERFVCEDLSEPVGVVGEIAGGRSVEQRFVAEGDIEVSSLYVLFATYARTNQCHLEIDLIDEQGQSQRLAGIDCQELMDNSLREIKIDPVRLEGGKWYTLRFLSQDALPYNSITIYRTAAADRDNFYAVVDGQEQDYALYAFLGK